MRLPETFVAVVTGGGSGLGRALSTQLAARGGRIVVADVDPAGGDETVARVRAAGGDATFVRCDVGDRAQVAALAERARAWAAADVDLVANNAGVVAGGLVGDTPLDDWRWTLDVNLWGAIHGCHAFVPAMRARRRGWVLNVASAAGFACLARFGPYSVAKAGVIALSETLRAELPREVAVTVSCPSFFRTNIAGAARGDDAETRSLVDHLMDRSKTTADDVARHAIASLEAGRLYSVPSAEAQAIRWARRLAPGSVHRVTNLARELLRRAAG
jgi:NAD(P)-dependent dehydrogenase (short-subunit alcohol dehydrogenase family)